MIHFESSQYFLLLLLIPLFLLLYVIASRKSGKELGVFSQEAKKRLLQGYAPWKSKLKFFFFSLALLFFVVALVNPRAGAITQSVKRQGIDVLLALDVSRSMLAEDVQPNRMERARQFALKYVRSLGGDRVGIILFAGQAYLQMPMTTDYAAAELFLRTAGPKLELAQGTAMEEVYRLALQLRMQDQKMKQKALLFITDGENHEEPNISAAAAQAQGEGISSFVLRVGTEQGGKIPLRELGEEGYHKDRQGNEVLSTGNIELMKELAKAGNGNYIDLSAKGIDASIAELEGQLARIEKEEFEERRFDSFASYYYVFLALGMLFLALEQSLGFRERKKQKA